MHIILNVRGIPYTLREREGAPSGGSLALDFYLHDEGERTLAKLQVLPLESSKNKLSSSKMSTHNLILSLQ
jgi:hypothetical protein